MTSLLAGPELGGIRLDSFLADSLPELTRSAAQRLIERSEERRVGRVWTWV